MKNKFYFVSCGPGDPELITVKGLKALQSCDAVLAPAGFMTLFADYLAGKEVASPFAMDRATLVGWVRERLQEGNVAILVPGDFSTFNPFQTFAAEFGEVSVVIPGVGSHQAASAILKRTYDQAGVAYATVVTSTRAYKQDGTRVALSELAGPGKTLVLYMVDMPVTELVNQLSVYPPSTCIAVFERLGFPDERITRGTLVDIAGRFEADPFVAAHPSSEPNLALVVVGDSIGADEALHWWDYRYEKLWKPRGLR